MATDPREDIEYAFHGGAVDDIRRALVQALYLAAEVDRIRSHAETAEMIGTPWPAGHVPSIPSQSMFTDIADAMLWIDTAPVVPAARGARA